MVNEVEERRDVALTEKAGKASKMIWVTFRKEGMHKYPAALQLIARCRNRKTAGPVNLVTSDQTLLPDTIQARQSKHYFDQKYLALNS